MRRILLLIAVFFLPLGAMATFTMEYNVPNGMPTISDAFQRIALIYSDSTYRTLFASASVLGMFLAFSNGYLIKPLANGINQMDKGTNWFTPFLVGSTIYIAAFLSTGTILVTDPVKNDFRSIPGVPDAVVLMAGMSNTIERIMINITKVATATIYPHDKYTGGINIQMFLDTNSEAYNTSNKVLSKNIQSYKGHCDAVSELTEQALMSGLTATSPTQYKVLESYNNKALIVDMIKSDGKLYNMTCFDAWTNVINPSLALGNFDEDVKRLCVKNGYDVLRATQLTACKNNINSLFLLHGNTSGSGANNYMREAIIAQTLMKKINLDNPGEAQLTLMRRQLVLQGMGAMGAVDDTMPDSKATMTAIILGIIPFLTLFMVTPLWLKALKFMSGSLLWLATWGVMDAVMHVSTMDAALHVLENMKAHGGGISAFMLADTDGVKAMMLFGKMQSNSLMMATAIAIAIYGFGSYAMTGMAQQQSSGLQGMGEKAAIETHTPEGRSSIRNALSQGVASDAAISIPPNGLSSGGGNWAGGTGFSAQAQTHLGAANRTLGAGDVMDVGSQRDIGVSNVAHDQGKVAGETSVANNNGNNLYGQVADTSETSAITQQTGLGASKEAQITVGGENQVSGAETIAAVTAGNTVASAMKTQTLDTMQGGDGSPDSMMNSARDLSLGQSSSFQATGEWLTENPTAQDNMSQAAVEMAKENPEQLFKASFTSDGEGSFSEFKLGVDKSASIDLSGREASGSSVVVDNTDTIKDSSHFDDATIKGLIQNTHSDSHYRAFENRFNQAKGVSSNPADDNKAARDNIINDVAYGFKDVSNQEVESDQIRKQNETSGTIGTPGKGLLGSSASNTTSMALSNNQEERTQVDTTRGKIAEIYEQSDNASQFLSKVNDFHTNQYNKMQEISQAGDLSKDNPTVKDKKNSQSNKDDDIGGA